MFTDSEIDRFRVWGDTIHQHLEKNMYSKALHEMSEYSMEAHKQNSDYAIGRSYMFAGKISDVLNNKQQAVMLYKQSINTLAKAGYKDEALPVYRNIALLYLGINQLDSAFIYIREGEELANTVPAKCSVYSIYSLIYYGRQDKNDFLHYMNLADKERAKTDSLFVDEYYFLKSIYFASQELSDDEHSFDKAFVYVDSINNEDWRHERVAKIYRQKGEFDKAYNTMREDYNYKRRALTYRLIDMYSEYKAHNDNFQLKVQQSSMVLQIAFWILLVITLATATGILLYLRNRSRYLKILEHEKETAIYAKNMKTTVIQNLRHEIRTPLNAILGFNQLLIEAEDYGLTKEEQQEYIAHVDSNVKLVKVILDDLLDISQMGTGMPELNISQTDVTEIVENVLFNARLTVHPGVKLENELPHKHIYMLTDPVRLQQLFQNVVNNACKYTDAGSITFSYEDKGADHAIYVTDTGQGIPVKDAERVFSRFEKLGSQVQGMGLGLSICRTIAKAMGGEIHVDTEYTEGCRMVMTLPKKYADSRNIQKKPKGGRSFFKSLLLTLAFSLFSTLSGNAQPQYQNDFTVWADTIYHLIEQYNFEKAFSELDLYHEKVEEVKDNLGRFLYYRLNGDIYRVMDDYSNAITYYKYSMEGDVTDVDSLILSTSYRRTAFCYQQIGNLDSLLYFGKLCVQYSPTPRMKRVIGTMEGIYYLKRAQYADKARAVAKKVMAIKGAEKVFDWDFDDYYYLVSFYYEKSDFQKALAYADSIFVPSVRNKKMQYLYVQQKDYEQALKYLEMSIKDEENFRIERLSSLVTTHFNLAGNRQLQMENQRLEEARQYIPLGIVGIVFLVFVGFMFFHIRIRNRYAKEVAHEREAAIRTNRLKDSIIKNVCAEMHKPLNDIAKINRRAAEIGHSSMTREEKQEHAEKLELHMEVLTMQIDHLLELAEHESEV